jgi:NitT/TauT family transport system substrate-binding protein
MRLSRIGVAMLVLWAGLPLRAQTLIRVGSFPNITHAQALIGKANGWFERALGAQTKIEWKSFNAGPSEMEALFARAIDLAYIGPNPTINGYLRSNGAALRVIAGATSGGAALVVRADSGIQMPSDFHGKKSASPQMGNTQDVSLRAWLRSKGLQTTDKGGDVQVIPIANPDQLSLFLEKQIDAAWAPEPWASRLVHEANGRLFLDERTLWPDGQFVTANIIVSTQFLAEHPDVVKSWLSAHVELTDWINAHPSEAKKLLNSQIQKETGKALSEPVLNDSFRHLQFTYDPLRLSLISAAKSAFTAGFLGREMPDLSGIYRLELLNQVLAEKGKQAVR